MKRKKLRAYLSGGMEYAKGEGAEWRNEMQVWLEKNLGHSVFNPNETSNAYFAARRLTKANFRKLKSSNISKYTKIVAALVEIDSNEIAYKTDYVVCYWNRSAAAGAGTKGEITLAKFFGKPVYMVTKMQKRNIPGWVLGCTSRIFSSFSALRKFLQSRYK
ncbi:MAG: hypothetical protein L0Y80_02210 [Ignavibacteriae bacterium]|nr:hypothetical protein [Ignavibacteriota bacterium]